jgi:V/A-type H+/Na+-transporting ATPase subunit K
MRKWTRWMCALVFACPALVTTLAMAAETGTPSDTAGMSAAYRSIGLGAAAAFTMAGCVLGAGYAVARIGAAAMGAAAEKPELLTRSLLFVALAEGLAVLGFAIAMMILQKV